MNPGRGRRCVELNTAVFAVADQTAGVCLHPHPSPKAAIATIGVTSCRARIDAQTHHNRSSSFLSVATLIKVAQRENRLRLSP